MTGLCTPSVPGRVSDVVFMTNGPPEEAYAVKEANSEHMRVWRVTTAVPPTYY